MIRTIIGLTVLVLLLLGLNGYQMTQNGALRSENATLAEGLKRAQAASERARATSARAAAEKRATARETGLLRQRLERALDAEQAWASTEVPKEVQDALP